MLEFIARRLVSAAAVLLIVSLVSFSIMRLVPGDPAVLIAGSDAAPQEIQAIRERLGLDQPFLLQLGNWYLDIARGDLGTSILLGQGVGEAILARLPVTLSLSAYALVIALAIGLLTGTIAALRQNTWIDQLCMAVALIGISLPNFWLGLMSIVLFAVWLGWFPTGGYVPFLENPAGWLRAATLPAVCLALMQVGLLARIMRSTMLDVISQDYIRTARASGVPQARIIYRHAMKNVMIPVMTVIGIILGLLVSGSVVIETVFAIPGVGRLIGSAILSRDYPVIQGGLLVSAAMMVMINLLVDVLYAYLDPRIRNVF